MAETTPEPGGEQPPPAKKSTLILRIGVVLFLVAVVLGEVLFAYKFLSGSPGNAAAAASAGKEVAGAKEASEELKKNKAEHGEKTPEAKEKERGSKKSEVGEHANKAANKEHGGESGGEAALAGDQCEVDLGKFTVTSHQTASNSTMRVDFRLFGIIATEHKEEFDTLLKGNQNRFREQVLVTVRSAEGTDLAEAGLGLIKRQILEKTNTLLGKPLVRSVIITDFSHIEQ
jgi:flagellar basal body-associated protein FliL